MADYIIASCKPWHRDGFYDLAHVLNETAVLHWAENPSQLQEIIDGCSPRYIFFLHWSWIVSEEIWSQHESVCFHMTDLPYGRGGTPLQNLIVRGHSSTKLTAFQMNGIVDGGPIYAKRLLSLEGRAESIYRKAGMLSYDMTRWIIENEPVPKSQTGAVIKFGRRKPADSMLPTDGSLKDLYDHIRMLDAETYPSAFADHGEFRLQFSNAELRADGTLSAEVVMSKPSQ